MISANWIYSIFCIFNSKHNNSTPIRVSEDEEQIESKEQPRDLTKERQKAIKNLYNYIVSFKELLKFDYEKSSRKLEYNCDMYENETYAWLTFYIENDPIIKELKMFVSNCSVGNGFKSKRTGKYYRIYLNDHLISRDWFHNKQFICETIFTDDMIENIIKILAEKYKSLDDKYYSNSINNFAF